MAQSGVNDSDNDGNIEIGWSADANASSYSLFRHTQYVNNATSLVPIKNTTSTSFEDNTTVNGTRYWYAVASVDALGNINLSLLSTSFNATADDENAPRLPITFNATTAANGSVVLNWSEVVLDVGGNTEPTVTYRIYRAPNTTALDLTTHFRGNTTNLSFVDTNMTTGINYTYYVLTSDDIVNYNNSNTTNHQIVAQACTTSYTYTDWSTCSSSSQSRTGTRTCYGGGSTSTTETQSCTSSSSSSGSGSSNSGGTTTVTTTGTKSIRAWQSVAKGESISLESSKDEISVSRISVKLQNAVSYMQLSVEKLSEKPSDVDEVKELIKSNSGEFEDLFHLLKQVREKGWI